MRRLVSLTIACGLLLLGFVGVGDPVDAVSVANSRIAFVTSAGACCNVLTMNSDGSEVTQVTRMPDGYGAFDPSWSPNGVHIVFSKQRTGDGAFTAQLWVVRTDGRRPHPLLRDPFFVDLGASYSPDGRRIVFTRCRPDFQACAIARIDADGTGLTSVTPFRVSELDLYPQYSPDGAQIAFGAQGRAGAQNAVYLMNANGLHIRRLTAPSLLARSPMWSPDGRRIVFSAHCCGFVAAAAIWTINVDRSGLQQITFPGRRRDFNPSYSPTGRRITFERDSEDFSKSTVWAVNADGTGPRKIRGNPSFEPRWGPRAN
jgi:Tol biopolymer transport system component